MSIATPKRPRLLLWMGLFLAISLDTSVQLCWRASVPQHGGMAHALGATLIKPLFLLSLLLHVWQLFNWMMVLALADLSFVQPITALSYIAVAISSHWLFSENLDPLQFCGIGLVLVGVILVSRTPSVSPPITDMQRQPEGSEATG
ncbi:MAG: hypothetical protein ACP5QA_00690 [Phycisphaerae bacterium]